MTNGCNDARYQQCATRRIGRLPEGKTALAQLAVEEGCTARELRSTAAVDVTQLMQQRSLLGENQQQRKCKNEANPTHMNAGSRCSHARGYHSRRGN